MISSSLINLVGSTKLLANSNAIFIGFGVLEKKRLKKFKSSTSLAFRASWLSWCLRDFGFVRVFRVCNLLSVFSFRVQRASFEGLEFCPFRPF